MAKKDFDALTSKRTLVLGIESTCDEIGCSVVENGKTILSNTIASQAPLFKRIGGVYPEISSRNHLGQLLPILDQALQEARVDIRDLDLIGVSKGPGLMGPLLIGINAAKALSLSLNIPFIGVNHVEAHIYAAMLSSETLITPSLGVVVSGGHTFLLKIEEIGSYSLIGTTQDDALGEAFDKVAAMLHLPYPGGPEVERLAQRGDAARYAFRAGRVKERPFDFSFSGLKTSVLYALRGQDGRGSRLKPEEFCHIAASFQECALRDVVDKSLDAVKEFGLRAIFVGGGVSCNQRFRTLFHAASGSIPLFWPESGLSLDNGAMVAGLAYHAYRLKGAGDSWDLEPEPRIPLEKL